MSFASVSLACRHQMYKEGAEPTVRNLKTKAKVAIVFDTFLSVALVAVGALIIAGVIPTGLNGMIPYYVGGGMIVLGLTAAIVDALVYRCARKRSATSAKADTQEAVSAAPGEANPTPRAPAGPPPQTMQPPQQPAPPLRGVERQPLPLANDDTDASSTSSSSSSSDAASPPTTPTATPPPPAVAATAAAVSDVAAASITPTEQALANAFVVGVQRAAEMTGVSIGGQSTATTDAPPPPTVLAPALVATPLPASPMPATDGTATTTTPAAPVAATAAAVTGVATPPPTAVSAQPQTKRIPDATKLETTEAATEASAPKRRRRRRRRRPVGETATEAKSRIENELAAAGKEERALLNFRNHCCGLNPLKQMGGNKLTFIARKVRAALKNQDKGHTEFHVKIRKLMSEMGKSQREKWDVEKLYTTLEEIHREFNKSKTTILKEFQELSETVRSGTAHDFLTGMSEYFRQLESSEAAAAPAEAAAEAAVAGGPDATRNAFAAALAFGTTRSQPMADAVDKQTQAVRAAVASSAAKGRTVAATRKKRKAKGLSHDEKRNAVLAFKKAWDPILMHLSDIRGIAERYKTSEQNFYVFLLNIVTLGEDIDKAGRRQNNTRKVEDLHERLAAEEQSFIQNLRSIASPFGRIKDIKINSQSVLLPLYNYFNDKKKAKFATLIAAPNER